MKTEAEIRAEIDRLEALAEDAYSRGRTAAGMSYWALMGKLSWVLDHE